MARDVGFLQSYWAATRQAFTDRALQNNTTGGGNTASGFPALVSNTTGFNNTASSVDALHFNSAGSYNAAHGLQALYHNARA